MIAAREFPGGMPTTIQQLIYLRMLNLRNPALRIAAAFLLLASLWILISDRAIEVILGTPVFQALTSPRNETFLQTLKGWAFVGVTAGGLYVVLRIEFRRRARSQALLTESERARKTLISNLPGVVYRCRIDHDWTMEFVSEGALELTGYPAQDFIENAKLSYASIIHADDRDQVWREVEEALEAEEPFRLTCRIMTASGNQKWVWEQGRAVTVTVDGKKSRRLEGFITDVTGSIKERQELERQLSNIQALRTIDLAVTSSLDQRLTMEVLLDQVTARLGIHAADVLLYSHHSDTLAFGVARGFRT